MEIRDFQQAWMYLAWLAYERVNATRHRDDHGETPVILRTINGIDEAMNSMLDDMAQQDNAAFLGWVDYMRDLDQLPPAPANWNKPDSDG